MVNVVAETPVFAHGETTEKPIPMPNASRISVIASDAIPPANTAFQLTVECPSWIAKFPVSVTMMAQPCCKRNNFALVGFPLPIHWILLEKRFCTFQKEFKLAYTASAC